MKEDGTFLFHLSVLLITAWTASVGITENSRTGATGVVLPNSDRRSGPVEVVLEPPPILGPDEQRSTAADTTDWPGSMMEMRDLLVYWKDAAGAVQSVVTILAIVVGGLVAYIKLVKGRLFSKRLEPSVSGVILQSPEYTCLRVTIKIKNVGLTRVNIDLPASSLRLEICNEEDYQAVFHETFWEPLGVVQAILYHQWVEPGEAIVEERLLAIPQQRPIAVNLRLRVLSKQAAVPLRQRTEWNALAVASVARTETTQTAVQSESVTAEGDP